MEQLIEFDLGRLRAMIADAIDVDEAKLLPKAHFIDDIGVDSLYSLEVLVRLEKEYDLRIPESDLPRLISLTEVEAYLREALAK
jgi:acyl carrier protein